MLSPTLGGLQRGSPAPRADALRAPSGCSSRRGRRPLHGWRPGRRNGAPGSPSSRPLGCVQPSRQRTAPRPSRGDRPSRQRAGPAMAAADYFRRSPAGLSIARQNSRPLAIEASLRSAARPVPPVGFVAMKAATVAVQPTEHPMSEHDDYEPDTPHRRPTMSTRSFSSTATPSEDEADPSKARPGGTASSKAPSPTSSTP